MIELFITSISNAGKSVYRFFNLINTLRFMSRHMKYQEMRRQFAFHGAVSYSIGKLKNRENNVQITTYSLCGNRFCLGLCVHYAVK